MNVIAALARALDVEPKELFEFGGPSGKRQGLDLRTRRGLRICRIGHILGRVAEGQAARLAEWPSENASVFRRRAHAGRFSAALAASRTGLVDASFETDARDWTALP